MDSDTDPSMSLASGRRRTPACFECKIKKRKCTHPTNEPGTMSPELSDARLPGTGSLHDEETSKSSKNGYDSLPTPSSISKRTTSVEPAPQMPEHPTNNLEGSARLGIHSVFSRELEGRINQMQAEQNAARLAFEEAMMAVQASIHSATDVIKLVDDWKQAWEKGQ
ncbi:uncharacterized protein N7483_010655 [Penicillium malachiteum]|uniref:uncharacterized protein n=1 Tax=Penicillium malachiteum TaxID=1324776 RepID=UPI002546B88A|nr:uncharacterized protein N7483_010655 [Penicillium malachiteum]KAJ5713474.1 hypothetical protein N7483_010655 [Penicillium malachiteum]